MRRVRIVLGLAVAVCAFGALAGSAFAKPKLVFGHFAASIVGRHISPTEPAKVVKNKEGEAEVTGLELGSFKFGVVETVEEKKKPNYEKPCKDAPKVTGTAVEEESSSLLTEVTFKDCVTSFAGSDTINWKGTNFKLAINFESNEAAELGNTDGGFKIEKTATVLVKGIGECVVEIPAQFVPAKSEEKEKFWDAAEYEQENEEPIEKWEKSKKLKEEYPGDVKERLNIVTTNKFKGIVSYVHPYSTSSHGCESQNEASGKLITEKEIEVEGKMVPNPRYGWLEYTNGRIDMSVTDLEIKGGQLTFVPPSE